MKGRGGAKEATEHPDKALKQTGSAEGMKGASGETSPDAKKGERDRPIGA
jgi:hypothetical protein